MQLPKADDECKYGTARLARAVMAGRRDRAAYKSIEGLRQRPSLPAPALRDEVTMSGSCLRSPRCSPRRGLLVHGP
jgi:hypothetical protein